MKLLSIMPIYPPYPVGCASYTTILVKFIDNKKIRRHSVISEYSKNFILKVRNSKIFRILPRRRSKKKQPFVYSLFSFFLYRIVIIISLIIFRFLNYRLCHFHSSISQPTDILFAKLLGYRITIDVRDLYILPKNIRFADNAICCSEDILRKVKKFGLRTNLFYIPIPLDFEELESIPFSKDFIMNDDYILYLGVISFDKGIDQLIQAFKIADLDSQFSRKLVLAGPLQDKAILDQDLKNIIYLGSVERNEAVNLIRNSLFVVVPGNFEGFPRVILESYYLNTPLVLNKKISKKLDLDCTGIDCNNSNEFSDALKKVYRREPTCSIELSKFDAKLIINKTTEIFLN